MKLFKAMYENTHPLFVDEPFAKMERTFYDRCNAERWLKSFGKGKYDKHSIIEVDDY
jgi:hypothetical protein